MDTSEQFNVTHVIFDVDGTILDTESLYTKAKRNVVAKYGAKEDFTHDLESKTAGKQAFDSAEIITEECNLPLTPDEFVAELDSELQPILPTARLKPGVERLILHLAGHNVPVAIATSSRKRTGKIKMSGHAKLFNLFSHTVFGSDDPEVDKGKPNPDIFLVAAKRFEDSPSPGNSELDKMERRLLNRMRSRELSSVRGQHIWRSGCPRGRHASCNGSREKYSSWSYRGARVT